MKTDRISLLLVGSILLTALSAIITHYAIMDSRRRVEWVFHTYEVIGQSTELLSVLEDAERRQRNYLITADSNQLQPFMEARTNLHAVSHAVRQQVSDNPEQAKLMNETIGPLLENHLTLLEEGVRIYQQHGRDSAFGFIRSNKGSIRMDSLRHSLAKFTDHEKVLLLNRLEKVNQTHRRQILIRYISMTLIASISFLALVTLLKKKRRNNELIGELKGMNESLEQRVRDRTRELQEKNVLANELNDKLSSTVEEIQTFYDALQMRTNKAEDTLNEIRDLYDYAPCGYHSLDANGYFIRINETELNWLGYTREEVINRKSITDLVTPESINIFLDNFEKFKTNGFLNDLEFDFIRKDGSVFPVTVNATAIYDEEGRFTMSRSIVFDISHRKKIEQKLKEANERLTHLNDDKNHFLGIAVHDLKSPVNGILGLLNLISIENETLSREQREYLKYIEQLCFSMKTLITNLLDINRIEQGMNVLRPETIDLSTMLQCHVKIFMDHALKKNITLTLEDHAPGTKINTDPYALRRILDNLVSNALKFSPRDSHVVLRLIHEQSQVKIEVADQGPGIIAEEMPNLFRKFQKLSARPTGGESSTGLGLSIVKELVSALKGTIYVKSEVRKGSTFVVELPLAYHTENSMDEMMRNSI
jgi:PAS domain S-box-containing protein